MERTWLETIQFLGLDLMVAAILLMLAVVGLATLTRAVLRSFRRRADRRPRATPTRPLDVWPSQEWGPSH
jgi:hypothetical protein